MRNSTWVGSARWSVAEVVVMASVCAYTLSLFVLITLFCMLD